LSPIFFDKMRAKIAGIEVEGTPQEVAAFARELGFHRGPADQSSGVGVSTALAAMISKRNAAVHSPGPDPWMLDNLRRKALSIPSEEVETWLRKHPSGSAALFLKDFFGLTGIHWRGPYQTLYLTVYNRLTRTRRKLGIPMPSHANGQTRLEVKP
jgi:hypothetical protein